MRVNGPKRNASKSRASRGGRKSKIQRRGPVKKKKQDITELLLGIGVGAFIFIIIAAASGGKSSNNCGAYS